MYMAPERKVLRDTGILLQVFHHYCDLNDVLLYGNESLRYIDLIVRFLSRRAQAVSTRFITRMASLHWL